MTLSENVRHRPKKEEMHPTRLYCSQKQRSCNGRRFSRVLISTSLQRKRLEGCLLVSKNNGQENYTVNTWAGRLVPDRHSDEIRTNLLFLIPG